ncbi:hypothetical protein AVEN_91589-1 [Araneus ventricosus]|uniref:RNase H type-1 domain-containing protein n=1 Tax=Araneus ventricosus TaxID=182803 RepID=A0A4Y2UC20_ARAVE|nr:hypothetical protein AVEN_91589-1 [Araneus ventricosus]
MSAAYSFNQVLVEISNEASEVAFIVLQWASTTGKINSCSSCWVLETSVRLTGNQDKKSNKILSLPEICSQNQARLVKAHIGIKGNEISDTLAKDATTDGVPASLPFPNIYLKTNDYSSPSRFGKLSGKMVRLADRFTAFFRKYQTNSCTIPENASNSPIAMAPSPPTSRDSVFIL